MPNQIIDQSGSYTATQFTGSNGTWILVGSQSSGDSEYSRKPINWKQTSVGGTVDEFKNKATGEYMSTTRLKVYQAAEAGSIFL